jgi:mannose-6-phosphate isomerase-like protein (cupin superfamily)
VIIGKVWGSTEAVLETPLLSIHRLAIKRRMGCSWHKHEFKWNGFYVRRGRLFIETRKLAYRLTDTTELGPGDLTTVAPGEFHRFVTRRESCDAIEFYYLGTLADDIVRETCGGPHKKDGPGALSTSRRGQLRERMQPTNHTTAARSRRLTNVPPQPE